MYKHLNTMVASEPSPQQAENCARCMQTRAVSNIALAVRLQALYRMIDPKR